MFVTFRGAIGEAYLHYSDDYILINPESTNNCGLVQHFRIIKHYIEISIGSKNVKNTLLEKGVDIRFSERRGYRLPDSENWCA